MLAALAILCGLTLSVTPVKAEVTLGEAVEFAVTASVPVAFDRTSVGLEIGGFVYERRLETPTAAPASEARVTWTPVRSGEYEVAAKCAGQASAKTKVRVKPAANGATDLGWRLETTRGAMVVRFLPEAAPNHVAHFAELARKGFFDGLGFHRVIKGFMAQGGDPLGTGEGGPGYSIPAEFTREQQPKHKLGTVSTARDEDPDSGGSQFFICFADVPRLDGKYTVFGEVAEGLDVLKKIEEAAGLPKDERNGMPPAELVKITKSTLVPLGGAAKK